MTNLPPITIGIPIYNCAPFLGDAIRSIFAQTHHNWELILVDDGSSDDGLNIALSIDDPRVRVLSDGKNRGLPFRLNQISQEAKYGFVARMDGDDVMHPERIERQLRLFDSNPSLDVVSCGTYSMRSDETLVGARGAQHAQTEVADIIAGRVGLVHAACIFRREWTRRNPYDDTLAWSEDFELWTRAAAKGDLSAATLAEPLYVYREDQNISARKLINSYDTEAAMIRRYLHGSGKTRMLAGNIAKKIVARTMLLPQVKKAMQARRNPVAPDATMRAKFATLLETVKSTRVPGLSS